MNFEKELVEYGLTEKESKVYLSLLTLGTSSVNEISEKSELIRTTTYDVLKSLKEKGLVTSSIVNKITLFECVEPKKLIEILDDKKSKIKNILPELDKLSEEKLRKPEIKLYTGREGMKSVFQEILKSKESLVAFSNNKMMVELLPFYAPNFIKKRVENKISIRIISEDSSTTNELLIMNDKKELRETRVNNKMKELAINQYIFEDKVAIFESKQSEPLGMIIKNKEYAKFQKMLFEELWKKSKK